MPLTQEDIDKWMPYILEKMETKFLTSNQFIPYTKKVSEMDVSLMPKYSHLSNKRGGVAKVAKSKNVAIGILQLESSPFEFK
jgi:hypothetical protein